MKVHRKLVAESAAKGTALYSLDTLYCSGNALATVQLIGKRNAHIPEQVIIPLVYAEPALRLSTLSIKGNNGMDELYVHVDFPGLQIFCDIKDTDKKLNIYDEICKNGLLNSNGLDTMKAELFVTMKGKLKTVHGVKTQLDTIHADKSKIVDRDKNAEILFEEDKVAQGGVMIAEVKTELVSTPLGNKTQYLIYNSAGALICSANEKSCMKGSPYLNCWSLLTYKDNRFSIANNRSEENDLRFLIRHLIDNGFL